MDHTSWCAGPYESGLTCCDSFNPQSVARGLRFCPEGVLQLYTELLRSYRLHITPIICVCASRGPGAQNLMGLNPLEPMFLVQVHAVLCDHTTEVHGPGIVLSSAYMSAHLVNITALRRGK